MKISQIIKKYLIRLGIISLIFLILFLLFNYFLVPWYVDSPEVKVPRVIGIKSENGVALIEESNLIPVVKKETFDENYPKGVIFNQKPNPGTIVKEGRRIYLFVSSGEPKIQMPELIGKSLRNARITLEKMRLKLGDVDEISSDFDLNTVVEQQFAAGSKLDKGTKVNVKVSAGPENGMVRVPNLLGKSLSESQSLLSESQLFLGKKTYQPSSNLLPNTIIAQYPSQDRIVNVGDSIDVVITKSVSNNN